MANKINYTIDFNIDKNGFAEINKQLDIIKANADKNLRLGGLDKDLQKASQEAQILKKIMTESWNVKLNQLDLNKVNDGLKKNKLTVDQLRQSFNKIGPEGAIAFNTWSSSILHTNMQLKQSNKLLDDMATTFKNTVRYGISSSIFNNLSNGIQKAFNYTKQLDTSLNDIRIVTGYSADEMEKFAVSANRVAKDLGKSTKDFTEASLIYYQQGLGAEEAQARAEVTLKAANVTGQTGKEVSEQLTAVWNGYKVTSAEAELYVDKLAAVAAATAADLEELSTGMSKVASAASIMGVDIDQLNAQLATIVSVTRQAPESVGVALKTIYARMSDIQSGLDDETTLGNYTEKMAQYGINVLDANGKLRDMGEVIEEIGNKWESLSREQQVALSQIMAGTRQYNNLLSLFDNWDQYQQAMEVSATSAGTLQKQQDIYMESIEAHLQKIRTEAERTYDILFDTDTVNGFADVLSNMLNIFNNFLEGVGGGTSAFIFFGSTIANIFSKQIGSSIERQIENIETMKANAAAASLKAESFITSQLGTDIRAQRAANGETISDAALAEEVKWAKELLQIRGSLTEAEYSELTALQQKLGTLKEEIDYLSKTNNISQEVFEKDVNSIGVWEKKLQEEKDSLKNLEEEKEYLELLLKQNENNVELDEADQKFIYSKIDKYKELTKDTEIQNNLEQVKFDIVEKSKNSQIHIQALIDAQNKEYEKQTNQVNKVQQGIDGLKAKYGELYNKQLQYNQIESYANSKIGIHNRAQAISELTQGFTSLISLSTMFTGILSTINDETTTTSQKAQQIFSVAIASLPIILKNLKSIKSILPNLATTLQANDTEASKLALSLGKTNIAALSSSVSIGTLTTSLGSLLVAAGAVTAALALIGLVVWDNKKRAEEGQRSIEALNQTIEDFKAQSQELQNTIKGIESSFQEYDDIIKTLLQCKKGTDEWNEALEQANDYILELLQKYPQLMQMDNLLRQDEGYMTYDQDVLKEYLNQIKQDQRAQAAAAIQTQARSQQRTSEVEIANFSNQLAMPYYMDKMKTIDSKAIGEKYITQLANAGATATTGDWYQKELAIIRDNMVKSEQSTKQSADLWYKMMLSHEEYQDQLKKMGNNIKLVNKTINNSSKVLASELLGTEANEITTKLLADEIEKAKRKKTTMFTDVGAGADKKSVTYEKALKVMNNGQDEGRYKEASQANVIQGGQGSLTGKSRKYYFYDSQTGETISKSGTYLNQLYESSELINKIDVDAIKNKADVFIESFSKISSLDKNTSLQILSKDFDVNLLSKEQYDKLKSQKDELYNLLNPNEILKDNTLQTGLQKQLSQNLDWKGSGYDSFQEWWTGYLEAMDQRDEKIAEEKLKQQFDTVIASNATKMKEKYELDEEDFKDYATHLSDIAADQVADVGDKLDDSMRNNAESTSIVAKSIMRMNQGIDELAKNWEDWSSILKKSSASSEEYSKALNGTRDALGDLLDIEEDAQKYFTNDFIQKHLKEIEKAAQGDAKAIESLRAEFAKDVVLQIYAENKIDMDNLSSDVKASIENLNTSIPDIRIGYTINPNDESYSKFLENCQNVIDSAKMTEEQANAYFASMGFEAEYEQEPQKVTSTRPVVETITEPQTPVKIPYQTVDEEGNPTTSYIEGPRSIQTSRTIGYTNDEQIEMATSMGVKTPDGKGRAPKIKSLTKKGTGSMNNYSSSNKGGNKSSGGGTKKSGGGGKKGKSGGSKADPDKMDPLKEEKDRYHEINVQLQLIENELKKLERAKEKAFGKAKIEILNEELKKYEEQIKTINQKLKIAQGETNELRNKLIKQGVKFGADGAINNYVAAIQAQENAVNKVINKYNGMSKEQQEKYKDTVEQEKKNFEEFKKDIDRYDELISNTMPELRENIQDAIDKQIDIQIEEFDMEIEIRLNLKDAKQDWNKFRKEVLEDFEKDNPIGDLFNDYEDLKTLLAEDNNGLAQSLGHQLQNTLDELYKMDDGKLSDVYGDNRVKALEDLKTYLDESISALEEIKDLEDSIHEDFIKNMDAIQDRFDKQIEDYETISKLLDHDKEIIELVSGDSAYKQLAQFYDKQEENYKEQLAFQNQQVIFWRQQLDTIDKSSDEWQEAKEKWADAVEEYNDLIEDSIENLQDKYLNTIKDIFNNLNNRLSGGRGLEGMNDQWKLLNLESEEYLDNVNSIYQTQQLANKYLDAIDNTSNIKAQQRLRKIMDDELDNLRQKDKLSEYDLQRAELRYQIAIKQIALEEAQQNKSKMRLRRDTQGNYRYEYVADDEQLNKSKQEISDFYNQLYNLDAKKYSENLEKVYNLTKEAEDRIQELYEDTTLSNDERQERILETTQYYSELIDQLTADNEIIKQNLNESTMSELFDLYDTNKDNYAEMTNVQQDLLNKYLVDSENLTNAAYDNLFDLYNQNVENFKNMTNEELDALMGELIPGWDSAYQTMIDNLYTEGGFVPATEDAYTQAGIVADEYYNKVIELTNQSNDANQKAIDTIVKMKEADEEVLKVANQQIEDGKKYINYLNDLTEARKADVEAAKAQTKAAYEYWQEQQRQAADAAKKEADKKKEENAKKVETKKQPTTTSNNNNNASSTSKQSSKKGDGKLAVGDTATYTGKYYYDSRGTAPVGSKYSGIKNGIIVDKINNNAYGIHIKSADGRYNDLGWVKKSQLSGYDTGGYTGEWGKDGRLALLHQKELVLNSTDTQNMLDAVKIIRQMTDSLGSSILNKFASIGSIGMDNLITGNNSIDQNVHIEANFPNVTKHDEIEQALNNLVNAAARRVNKKI